MENFLLVKLGPHLRKCLVYVAHGCSGPLWRRAPLEVCQTNKDLQWIVFRCALKLQEKQ